MDKNYAMKKIIGIDLGGTSVKIGVVDMDYNILAQISIPTMADRPYEEVIADIGAAVNTLLQENNWPLEECAGAGIGSPGTIDSKNGVVLYSNNIAWKNVPFVEEFQKYVPLPAFINNDANCAALGEVVKGAAKGCNNAVFFTLGTGVGGGIVIDGKVFEGGHPGGAEIGHMIIHRNGRQCTCGRKGCLEAYASATALISEAKHVAAKNNTSLLFQLCEGDLEQMNAKIPFDAAKQGDPDAKEIVEEYIGCLGDGITNIVNIFRPDIIVLGGGVCAQGEYLTVALHEQLKRDCFGGEIAYVPEVVIAQNGNQAGIIGAASLVERDSFKSDATLI